MSAWLDAMNAWLIANPHWLGVAVFLIACTECLAIVGLIVPGTVALFAVAALAGSGTLGLGETLLLGYLGGLLGDGISYFIGRYCHQGIRRLPGLRTHPQWLESAEGYFRRYGIASLLVGRFIGPLRPMLPMVAGMFDMPLWRFIGVSLVAAAGWSVVYLMPGWAAGAALRLPLPPGFWLEAGIVAAALAAWLGLSLNGSLRRQRHATLWVGGVGSALLIALLIFWPDLNALDQGLMTLIQEHRKPALDTVMITITVLGDFRTQFIVAALVCAVLLVSRQWRHLIFAIGTLLGTALANTVLKHLFSRARPGVLLDPLSSFSMPSGHSSASFALFMTLAILAGRGQPPRMRLTWTVLACLPALAIAMSRVYLGAHWPSDILAGAMLACSVCGLVLALVQWRGSLPAMSPRVWWLLVPVCVAGLGAFALHALPHALTRYQY